MVSLFSTEIFEEGGLVDKMQSGILSLVVGSDDYYDVFDGVHFDGTVHSDISGIDTLRKLSQVCLNFISFVVVLYVVCVIFFKQS